MQSLSVCLLPLYVEMVGWSWITFATETAYYSLNEHRLLFRSVVLYRAGETAGRSKSTIKVEMCQIKLMAVFLIRNV